MYCQADTAHLCALCDKEIHASKLASRHSRMPLEKVFFNGNARASIASSTAACIQSVLQSFFAPPAMWLFAFLVK